MDSKYLWSQKWHTFNCQTHAQRDDGEHCL